MCIINVRLPRGRALGQIKFPRMAGRAGNFMINLPHFGEYHVAEQVQHWVGRFSRISRSPTWIRPVRDEAVQADRGSGTRERCHKIKLTRQQRFHRLDSKKPKNPIRV